MATDTEEDYKLFKVGFNTAFSTHCSYSYDYVVARNYNSAVQLWQNNYRNSIPALPDSVELVARRVIM